MISDPINTTILIAFGALLGVLGALFLILIGFYSFIRRFPFSAGKFEQIAYVINLLPELLKWQNEIIVKIESDALPRSTKVVFITTMGLFCLCIATIWLIPIIMNWVPFLCAFVGGDLATIGLFELSRLIARRKFSP